METNILKFIENLTLEFFKQELVFDAINTKGMKFTNQFIKRTGNAAYEIIKNRLEECGVKVISEIGDNLYHCYPFFPVVKEAKLGWENMYVIRFCRSDSSIYMGNSYKFVCVNNQ